MAEEPKEKVIEEAVFLIQDDHGELTHVIRRDRANHGRVQVLTVQAAAWDEIKGFLKELSGEK